jgi:RNA polymerase sigma-70 factor (ECF subfamily)
VHARELLIDGWHDEAELAVLASWTRGGSEAAFEELVGRVHGRVRRWARRLTGDDDEAEDVAQLVLVRLHARSSEFVGRSRFTSWLYQITRNLALDRLRTEKRRAMLLARSRTSIEGCAVAEDAGSDDSAARLAHLVRAYRAELPRRQREVFELVDMRGHSPVEVAERLGISPATVRVLLLKARRAIRSRMLAEHPRLLEEYRS